jgi:hypothetical protein
MAGSRLQRGWRLRLDSFHCSLAGFLSKQQQEDLSHKVCRVERNPPRPARGRLRACPAAEDGSFIELTRGSQQAKVLTSWAKPKHS